jgi:hypothetical protein
MFKSEYFKLLQTNRRTLMLKLTQTECAVTGAELRNAKSTSKIYEVALTDNTSESVETRSGALTGTNYDDLGAFQEVTVQLIERGYSEFRNWDCPARVYKNCDIVKLIQSFMSTPIKSLDENMKTGYSCTVYPIDNPVKFYQKIIPEGIRLYKFPKYMQKTHGVYGNGLGSYLSNGMWYIYPLHNVKRYNDDTKRMTIINVPPNEMVGNYNSYFVDDGGELYVYATGDTKHIDSSDRKLSRVGTGFRTVNSNNLLDHFIKNDKGVLQIPKGQNLINVNFDDREGYHENISTKRPVSGNRFEEASKIIAGFTNTVIVNWEYSNVDLLYPGMPVRFIYKYNGKPKILLGVLAGTHTVTQTPTQSITDHRYKPLTQLILTTERATT